MSVASHPAAIDVAGTPYLRDAKGNLVPLASVKAADLLMDETVRAIVADASEVSALVSNLKAQTFEKVGGLSQPIIPSPSRARARTNAGMPSMSR